jgi:hypothetical protein
VSAHWEVTTEIPMKLPSMANLRLHWAVKATVFKRQRHVVGLALRGTARMWLTHWKGMASNERLCLYVTLTRVGPRALDDDNLAHAFKAVRDEVAAFVGLDDGSKRFTWAYRQERGLYAVRIKLEVEHERERAA